MHCEFFALGLHPTLVAIASLLGDRDMCVAYCDDIHLLAPPHVIEEIIPLMAATEHDPPPPPPPPPAVPPASAALISTGLRLSPGNVSIYSPLLSLPATRAAMTTSLRRTIQLLGNPSLPSFASRASALLRGDGSTVASGHPVLGSPIGTDEYVETAVAKASFQ